jgi:SAM-dependent methyltransferase
MGISDPLKIGKMKNIWEDAERFRHEIIEEVMPQSGFVLNIGYGGKDYDIKNCKHVTLDIQRGHPSVWGTAEQLPFKSDIFDLVIATEIIEHLRYPKQLLDEVYRILKVDGKWLMSTPNVATLMNRMALLCLGRFCPDRELHHGRDGGHLHFWGTEYLLEVLNENGFKVVKSWHKFLQVSPQRYISTRITDSLFRNLCEQNLYLCEKHGRE